MKILAEREQLLAAFSAAAKVAQTSRLGIPILAHARVNAMNGKIHVAAHALDHSIETEIDAEAKEKGSITLPAAHCFGLIQKMPNGAQVEIDVKGDKATVRAGRSRYSVPALPAGDFPEVLLPGDEAARFTLSGEQVNGLFARPSFAVYRDNGRPMLTGVFLHFDGDNLIAFSCNERQAFKITIPAPEGCGAMPKDATGERQAVLIPESAMREIARMSDGQEIEIAVSARIIEASRAGSRFAAKLLDYQYPPYERLIKPKPLNGFRCERAELQSALGRLAVIADNEGKGSIIAVHWKKDASEISLSISHAAGGTGEGSEFVSAETGGEIAGPAGIPVKQFLSSIEALTGEQIEIRMEDNTTSMQITDPNEPGALILQNPARV